MSIRTERVITCDSQDCTTEFRWIVTQAVDEFDAFMNAATREGWTDPEAHNYCPGCSGVTEASESLTIHLEEGEKQRTVPDFHWVTEGGR